MDAITNEIASSEIFGAKSGDLLILSWGGTKGACRSATEALKADGKKVGHLHLRWINPFPKDLGEKLIKFKNILMSKYKKKKDRAKSESKKFKFPPIDYERPPHY